MIDLNNIKFAIESIKDFRVGKSDGEIVEYKGDLYKWYSNANRWLSLYEESILFTSAGNFNNVYFKLCGISLGVNKGINFSSPVFFTNHCMTKAVDSINTFDIELRVQGTPLWIDTFLGNEKSKTISYDITDNTYEITNINDKHELYLTSVDPQSNVISRLFYRKTII